MLNVTYMDSMRSLIGLPTSTQRAYALEKQINDNFPLAEFPLGNYFAPGVYVGTMLVRKDHVLVGAVHKTRHIAMVAKGRIAIDCDGGVRIFSAGDIMISEPGVKRSGLALEDTIFVNIHANPTDETDYPKLIEMLTESTFDDLIESKIPTLYKMVEATHV